MPCSSTWTATLELKTYVQSACLLISPQQAPRNNLSLSSQLYFFVRMCKFNCNRKADSVQFYRRNDTISQFPYSVSTPVKLHKRMVYLPLGLSPQTKDLVFFELHAFSLFYIIRNMHQAHESSWKLPPPRCQVESHRPFSKSRFSFYDANCEKPTNQKTRPNKKPKHTADNWSWQEPPTRLWTNLSFSAFHVRETSSTSQSRTLTTSIFQ